MRHVKYIPMYAVALASIYNLAVAQGLYGLGKWFWIHLVMGVALLAASTVGCWVILSLERKIYALDTKASNDLEKVDERGEKLFRRDEVERELLYSIAVISSALRVLFREWLSLRKDVSTEVPWAIRSAFEKCHQDWLGTPEVLYQLAQPWNHHLVLLYWRHFAFGGNDRMRVLEYIGRVNGHEKRSEWHEALVEAELEPYTAASLKQEAKEYGNVDLEL